MKPKVLNTPVEKFTRKLFSQVIEGLAILIASEELSFSQVAALHIIDSEGFINVNDISSRLNLSLSATSRLLDDLVKGGLIARNEDSENRRSKIISLTLAGKSFMDKLSIERVKKVTDSGKNFAKNILHKTISKKKMKSTLLTLFILTTPLVLAETHHHSHDLKHQETKIRDLGASKFVATKDLKIRMEKISTQVNELTEKETDDKAVKDFGAKISETVQDIFKTCKLEPQADAAIHPVLAQILSGTKELKKGNYELGHQLIKASLSDYEKLFTHGK